MRPQRNAYRQALDLSGIWRIAFDPDDAGERLGWANGLPSDAAHPIAIPGSWNEQLAELGAMNFVGTAWLETSVIVPAAGDHVVELRFGSVDYFATVYIDGAEVGRSGAPMLPFTVPVPPLTSDRAARVVVRVSNLLPVAGPTQRVTRRDYLDEGRLKDEYLPAVRFDFFPFGGINRPVHLVTRPRQAIRNYRVYTRCTPHLTAEIEADGAEVMLSVSGGGQGWQSRAPIREGIAHVELPLPGAGLWSPASPTLYDCTITLLDASGGAIDAVAQRIGIREVRVEGNQLLLNGEPLQFRGFGKHEDSPIHGRGLNLPQLVKDFGLLKWLGANSVRTSHYPYAEEFYDLADEMGILVIDEVFSINLDFRKVDPETLDAHKQAIAELIARDRNRTCVIAWSLANEPGYLGETEYQVRSGNYWEELFAHTRALDSTRPLTHANVQYAGLNDPAFGPSDFLSINRYHGWYTEPGQLDLALAKLQGCFEALAQHGKPIFVSEFGADAMAGEHGSHDQLFTEEYQARFIAAYWEAIVRHPSVIGGHVWNFADFRTAQHGRRVVHNRKGVFTRTREPKLAAWLVRRLWTGRDILERP
jgi:beta-glucuronidase